MIVDALESRESGDDVERSARVRWDGGELRLRIRVPAAYAGPEGDGSPFLAAALQPAMRCGEDLRVDAPVSPLLLESCDLIQRVYTAFWPPLRRAKVEAAGELEPAAPGEGHGCFFSRGLDSTYSAVQPRRPPLTALVFCDGLEPRHDERTRAEEIRLARGVAEDRIGLPLIICETNVRELVDPIVPDWEDAVGGGLAFIAHALAGGLGRIVIASVDDYASLEPCGTHPLLDPLYSSERMAIEHDSIAPTRQDKADWLARERPDLVAGLKVCFKENTSGNCGRCGKCVHLMCLLEAAGGLELAEFLPDEVDPDLVARNQMRHLKAARDYSDPARSLAESGRNEELREAILTALARSSLVARGQGPAAMRPSSFRSQNTKTMLSLLLDGVPHPHIRGAEPAREADLVGLVRLLRRDEGRHVYSVGGPLRAEVVGELGALHVGERPGTVPVDLDADGVLRVPGRDPARTTASLTRRLRWAVAPLGWRGDGGAAQAVRTVVWRLGRLMRARRRGPAAREPAVTRAIGHLHAEQGPGLLPLYAAFHPVTGDQLLSTSRWEAVDLGYGEPTLLGYLEPASPTTGLLGSERPRLPWASRYGQRVRE